MANPFLVLGGVAVGIVVAAAGVLTVPGWIASAQDASAINDLANIANAQAVYRSTKGVFSDDIVTLSSGKPVADGISALRGAGMGGIVSAGSIPVKIGEEDPSFNLSSGVTLKLLATNGPADAFCAVVQSPSGKYFAASESTPKSDGSTDIQTVLDNAQCEPDTRGELAEIAPPATATAPMTGYFRGVAYGAGRYVAVGSAETVDGITTDQIVTSTDGLTWKPAVAPHSATRWWDIVYGNGLFVALAVDGQHGTMTSPDGLSWTASPATASQFLSISFGNGRFVASAADAQDGGIFATSTDGMNWTYSAAPDTQGWGRKIVFGNGVFVTTGPGNKIATSADGTNWTFSTTEMKLTPLMAFTGQKFGSIAVSGGVTSFATSSDGVHWSITGEADWKSSVSMLMFYGGGKFMTVGINANGKDNIQTSSDGLTWTSADIDGQWWAAVYANGCFVIPPGMGDGLAIRLCE